MRGIAEGLCNSLQAFDKTVGLPAYVEDFHRDFLNPEENRDRIRSVESKRAACRGAGRPIVS